MICESCGKKRAASKPSARDVPDVPYEECVKIFGEKCGICGYVPAPDKKLHRDHDHSTGTIRGLLCFQCNIQLKAGRRGTVDWLLRAAAYLIRAAARNPKGPLY
jgi:hypothetical protein